MARGFESKDVEFQQAEAERRSRAPKVALTAAEREVLARRRTLELSLTRARADLAAAASPRHRDMLVAAIASLEAELASTGTADPQAP